MAHPTRRLNQEELQLHNIHKERAEIMEKDDTELRLEKMLFGDEASFLSSLTAPVGRRETALARIPQGENSDEYGEADDVDMEDVPDEELFFLDVESSRLPDAITEQLEEENEELELHNEPPVWADSDDERITISLASNARLRKLRDTENDDIITGTEYIRRLRRQYQRLHPTPEWVKYAYKKRRMTKDGAESDSGSDISIDDHVSQPSAQPLSELLRSAGSLTRDVSGAGSGSQQVRRLCPEVIDIQRVKDVAGAGPSSIDTMQFHSHFPLLLTGGPSATVNIYHVSPQPPNPNPLVTSLHLKNTPLHTAGFCNSTSNSRSDADSPRDATRIVLSSRRRYFHVWSLATGTVQKVSQPIYGTVKQEQKTMELFKISPCGRYMGLVGSGKKGGGAINVLSTETMQWICACRIDSRGGVADFAWWSNGDGFAVVGKNGEVSEYYIEQKRVISRWLDEGAVGTTVIALGGETARKGLSSSRWVATGSSSGIVNVYDRREWTGSAGDDVRIPQRPKPNRAFDQLTTPTSHLEFSHDGQMLVMGSRWKKNALRLAHLPSCTVYRNWPTDRTPLGRISSIALSMDGGYLAVANEQGKIRLFQIRD